MPMNAEAREQAIVTLWQDAFRLEEVGRNANFFELGGNSLMAMELAEKISERLGVELSAVTLFLNPTPRELAASLEMPAAE